MRKLFETAVKFYDAGQLDQAERLFIEVQESGVEIAPDGYTAIDYLDMIKAGGDPAAVIEVEEVVIPETVMPAEPAIEIEAESPSTPCVSRNWT